MHQDKQKQLATKLLIAANDIVKGYKGKEFLEAGYVYASYVPVNVDVLPNKIMFIKEWLVLNRYNASGFLPTKIISSRYSTATVNPKFYGLVSVDGIGEK